MIGLHFPSPDGDEPPHPRDPKAALVRLGFETTSPLEVVRDRLVAAGHAAEIVVNEVTSIHVTDPDSLHLEIHPHIAWRG